MDSIRRLLAAGVVCAALLSLLPFVPQAFGYHSATVRGGTSQTQYPSASTAPTTRFISCQQVPGTFFVQKGSAMSGTLLRVRCQNNWVMPVNVQLSMGDAAGSGISISAPPSGEIPPGGAACIDVRATAAARDTNAYLVAYQGTVNTSTLVATFRFTGEFEWAPGNPKNPITCTP